ncbi:response regulator [Rhizobium sp. SSA_523]|uniref:response regulator n=1 Tax=Rhizobium sp. SSA_523 TaxID=2952477 RepID=UPI00265A71C2|nr:response regulator [Rhizobium sp. SSA_523]
MDLKLSSNRPTILVLEDDVLLAMDMEDHLVDLGYSVAGPFGRIDQVLKALPELDIVGAVVDLNLNGELSFPVIEALGQRQVPVIVCSGYAELPEVKSKLAGVPLIAKPWSPDKMERLVADVFNPICRKVG